MNAAAKPPPRIRIGDISSVVDASRLLHWLAHVGRIEGLTCRSAIKGDRDL